MSEGSEASVLSADQGPATAEPSSPSQDSDMPLPQGRRPLWWHFSRAARRTRFFNYANILFVFVPIGFVTGILQWPPEIVFALNLLALIRLAPLITFSIDELLLSVGRRFGQLMQPTSGNAVEMIVKFPSNYWHGTFLTTCSSQRLALLLWVVESPWLLAQVCWGVL
jgi:hypothetical protein